jgi:hypothetical protein
MCSLFSGGDLRLSDQNNHSPRDWATMEKNSESRLETLSIPEEASMKNNEVNDSDSEVAELNISSTPEAQGSLDVPIKLPNTLAAIGLACSEDGKFFGTSTKVNYHF